MEEVELRAQFIAMQMLLISMIEQMDRAKLSETFSKIASMQMDMQINTPSTDDSINAVERAVSYWQARLR